MAFARQNQLGAGAMANGNGGDGSTGIVVGGSRAEVLVFGYFVDAGLGPERQVPNLHVEAQRRFFRAKP
jgi:hypothetical protein